MFKSIKGIGTMSNKKRNTKKKSNVKIGKHRKDYLVRYGDTLGIIETTKKMTQGVASGIKTIGELLTDCSVKELVLDEVVAVLSDVTPKLETAIEKINIVENEFKTIQIPRNKATVLTSTDYYGKLQETASSCLAIQEEFLTEALSDTFPNLIELIQNAENKKVA